MSVEYQADNIIIRTDIYESLFYHLDNKIPWIDLKEPQVLFSMKISGVLNNQDEYLILQYGNKNNEPYLAAYLSTFSNEPISDICVFTNGNDYIFLHYLLKEKTYCFRLRTNENPY